MQILSMGDNLDFGKINFCGLFKYHFIQISKQIPRQMILRGPKCSQLMTYFVENPAYGLEMLRDTTSHDSRRKGKRLEYVFLINGRN